ncbi:MAG: phosphopentomutase [Lachnospiraceae bacterium]|nr:phosphopentomutase [Lachnospiraceae bacterium]
MKRVIVVVLDSVGCGAAKDAAAYGDAGSNTLLSVSKSQYFSMNNLAKLGYFNFDGSEISAKVENPIGDIARMRELSVGKDTTTGHWEMAGVVSTQPMPTYPNGFPDEVLDEFKKLTGRDVLCNLPYSGTDVIRDYGEEHMKTGALIVYTSADSVFQIAAHEDVVPVEELYRYCEMARKMLVGKHGVGRVIARPFIGEPGNFTRTSRRHDFSLEPTGKTMLDVLKEEGYDVLAVGKINDIFAGRGVTDLVRTENNADGIDKTIAWMDRDFHGMMFVNLVDTDMIYGHRRDVDGYAKALAYFDEKLPQIMDKMTEDDMLMITADHGCDPAFTGTDHTREDVPLLIYSKGMTSGKNFGTIDGFDYLASTALHVLGAKDELGNKSLY